MKKDLAQFRKNFLQPDEHNSADVIKSISDVLTGYLATTNPLDPYAGNPTHDYSFLRDFEEIPDTPTNPETVRRASAKILSGSVRRHSPSILQNIITPPALDTVAIATLANLLKGNMMWDFNSAGAQEAEQQVVRQLSRLFGWAAGTDGVFTYGGKGCLTYAVRAGLNRCIPSYATKGLAQAKVTPVVLTSEDNHFTIESICSLLGLGSDACIRIATRADQTIDITAFEEIMRRLLKEKRPIACVVLSGGNTNNLNIDPIRKARAIIKRLAKEYALPYSPFLYADTVVGWAWLFFNDYDFAKNPLAIAPSILQRLQRAVQKLADVHLADAAGADFHKIGFTPYSASTVVFKNKTELHSLFTDTPTTFTRQPFGKNFPHAHTIEFSRSTAPVLSAWTALQTIGKRGFQVYLAQMLGAADVFREILPTYGIEWVNTSSLNHMSVFYPAPPSGPPTYKQLLKASPQQVEVAKRYAYGFFSYLADPSQDNPVAVRFLLNYTKCRSGDSCSMICICPASPYIDIQTAQKLAHLIGQKKLAFDKQTNREEVTPPYAVHK